MADEVNAALAADELRQRAQKCWAQGRPQAALDAAWEALDRGLERATKQLLSNLLAKFPAELKAERRADYFRLLTDREVEPDLVNAAGWYLVLRDYRASADTDDATLEALTQSMQRDTLALALLREAPVGAAAAERLLSRMRRWLLLSGQWRAYPELVAALKLQASLNGGAWPFDELERAQLENTDGDIVAAYFPARRPRQIASAPADAVTRAVATQYEGWPYPPWARITLREPRRLADAIRDIDAGAAAALQVKADILIAGCGTGREAAIIAQRYPNATVTAIDLSETSLDYGRRRCGELGITSVRFLRLDLHEVASLGEKFHAISCYGVLHHLPDPERGLRILSDALHPGGIMWILVYSKVERFGTAGGRTLIRDLMEEPMSDDLLRRVRGRLLQSEHPLAVRMVRSPDFYTLAGVHDMLLHRHEDPFDLPRLQRALRDAGLRIGAFHLQPDIAARYVAMFPGDPKHRDIELLARFETSKGGQFVGNYQFWCHKSLPQ